MTETDLRRLLYLLETVEKEGRHLIGTSKRLFVQPIDCGMVEILEEEPELAERVDAFGARFGRMRDTIGDKLIPELLRQTMEQVGTTLDNLNRMEKLGLLSSVSDWAEARNLRNYLVHEYGHDAEVFTGALNRASELVPLLVKTSNAIHRYARTRFGETVKNWPPLLEEGH